MADGKKLLDRIPAEIEDADAAREATRGKPAIDRLVEAALRSIRANSLDVVGKDGRQRVSISKLSAEHDMIRALRDLGKMN